MAIDPEIVVRLAEILGRYKLAELEVRSGEEVVRLRASTSGVVATAEARASVSLSRVSAWRWTDGDWIVEAALSILNEGEGALEVEAAGFLAEGMHPWADATALAPAILAPGESTSGIVAWFSAGSASAPSRLSLSWRVRDRLVWSRSVAVARDAARDRGVGASEPIDGGAQRVTFSDPVVFRWSDGDWIVRVKARVEATGGAVKTGRRLFSAIQAGREMSGWAAASTFPLGASVEVGRAVEGDVAWFCSGSRPQPVEVDLYYGEPGASAMCERLSLVLKNTFG